MRHCTTCGQPLPFTPQAPGQPLARWACIDCGTIYHAELSVENFSEALQHVRPCRMEFNRQDLGYSPIAIADFLSRLIDDAVSHERRQTHRYLLCVPAVAQPLDERFCPTGPAFAALVRDVSTSGIALVHTRFVHAKLLAVELSAGKDERMQFVIQVLRCQTFHYLYEIAGKFLVRLSSEERSSP
jgi:hypothetical protein